MSVPPGSIFIENICSTREHVHRECLFHQGACSYRMLVTSGIMLIENVGSNKEHVYRDCQFHQGTRS
ncbi:hypothetical protein DPMN_103145 [Dreissena polymorpha]|uniref:Uncharacterized protein n=1 Tax=Dreissena polymorpha TaxID=45954 RepID=A0A9D4H5K9_DREPO|nr:hypothetical protein DPMN_103145 [Dreissena polymorpha]